MKIRGMRPPLPGHRRHRGNARNSRTAGSSPLDRPGAGQYSTGGKTRLGTSAKAGDAYLQELLVQGARSVLHTAATHRDPVSRWALDCSRAALLRTLVAIANKNGAHRLGAARE